MFDAHLDTANRWVKELIESLAIPASHQPRALRALRAGLHAIRDRLPANEVLDLGAQLPVVIRGVYYEGWTLHKPHRQIRDRSAMLAAVKRNLAPDVQLDPTAVLRAVIRLLVAHISRGEIDDMLATLPRPVAGLWHELSGHPVELPRAAPHRGAPTHRTGYSR